MGVTRSTNLENNGGKHDFAGLTNATIQQKNVDLLIWLSRSYTCCKSIDRNGQVIVTTKVPDTITSWVASAFALSNIAGLGVSAETAKVKYFYINILRVQLLKRCHFISRGNV